MSAFYPSTSAGGQLSLLQDMATDHCGRHVASVYGSGLRASVPPIESAVERHTESLTGSRITGLPPNFLSYADADFRDFCPPAVADVSAAAKVSPPTGPAVTHAARRCRSDESVDCGLDLTGMEMRDVFKPSTAAVDHRPLGSPTSSSSNHRHPDMQRPQHLQQHQLRSELLQQQQQHNEELFMQHAARQWYLHHSPTTSATSASALDPSVANLVNGRSPGAAPPSIFRHEPTGNLVDIASGTGPHCHWPPPSYSGPVAPATVRQASDPHQKELSPTQKTGDGGVPFYPWMAVVGLYTLQRYNHLQAPCHVCMVQQHNYGRQSHRLCAVQHFVIFKATQEA